MSFLITSKITVKNNFKKKVLKPSKDISMENNTGYINYMLILKLIEFLKEKKKVWVTQFLN